MMDRRKAAELPKLQVGFIDFVCTFVYKVSTLLCTPSSQHEIQVLASRVLAQQQHSGAQGQAEEMTRGFLSLSESVLLPFEGKSFGDSKEIQVQEKHGIICIPDETGSSRQNSLSSSWHREGGRGGERETHPSPCSGGMNFLLSPAAISRMLQGPSPCHLHPPCVASPTGKDQGQSWVQRMGGKSAPPHCMALMAVFWSGIFTFP